MLKEPYLDLEYVERLSKWLAGGSEDEISESDLCLEELLSDEDLLCNERLTIEGKKKFLEEGKEGGKISSAPFPMLVVTGSEVSGIIDLQSVITLLDQTPSNENECQAECVAPAKCKADEVTTKEVRSLKDFEFNTFKATIKEVRNAFKETRLPVIPIIVDGDKKLRGLLTMPALARKLVRRHHSDCKTGDPVAQAFRKWAEGHPLRKEKFLPVGRESCSPQEILDRMGKDPLPEEFEKIASLVVKKSYVERLSAWLAGGSEDVIPEEYLLLKEFIQQKDLLSIEKLNIPTIKSNEELLEKKEEIISTRSPMLVVTGNGNGVVLGTISLQALPHLASKVEGPIPAKCENGCPLRHLPACALMVSNLKTMDATVREVRDVFRETKLPMIPIVGENKELNGILTVDVLARKLIRGHYDYDLEGSRTKKDGPLTRKIREWAKGHLSREKKFLPILGELYSPQEILNMVENGSLSEELKEQIAPLLTE